MHSSRNNIGAEIKGVACGAAYLIAAGAGDATEIDGADINRTGFDSCQVILAWKTTLTAAKTLSIAVELQESDDGTTWDTAEALQASTVVATGAVTDSVGETLFNVDFAGRKKFIRFNFTPDLSHTSTDTAVVSLAAILGGASVLPTDLTSSVAT